MLCGLSNKEKNCALCATGPALMNEENSLSRKIIANYFLVLYKPEESFWGGGYCQQISFSKVVIFHLLQGTWWRSESEKRGMEPRWYHSEMNLNMRNEKNEGRKENGLGSVYKFFWEGAFGWWLLRGDEGVSDRVCKEGIDKS